MWQARCRTRSKGGTGWCGRPNCSSPPVTSWSAWWPRSADARLPKTSARAQDQDIEITGAAIRSIIDTRRLRDEMLGPGIGDADWTLLLEVLSVRLDGRRPGITRLIEAA
jgi:hypothetical protein